MRKINRNSPPECLSNGNITLDNWYRHIKEIREALELDFESKCAYCESDVGITSRAQIENFYPKSKYPFEIAFDWNNLLLSCEICNVSKRDKFPIDDNEKPLLINPSIENPDSHLKLDEETGLLNGLTEKGKITITTLRLNRPALVANRKEKLLLRSIAKKYPQVHSTADIETIFNDFEESLNQIRQVLTSTFDENAEKFVFNMLYASVITAMETYLSDVFINALLNNQTYLRKFVETYPKFKKTESSNTENVMKFQLSEIFEFYDTINDIVIKEVLAIIYHNLRTVSPMFKDTFNVIFPKNLGAIYKAILIRHDIVHRNGRTKIDETTKVAKVHNIEKKDVQSLIMEVEKFIKSVDEQMNKI